MIAWKETLWPLALCLAAALIPISGCDDNTSPGVQLQIVNHTNSFEFQLSDVRNLTSALQYTWRNTGMQADVNQATTLTAGSATLVVRDAGGSEVYSRSLAENGTFVTTTGVSGDWTIHVLFDDASGTLNFRVEKRP